MVKPIRNNIVFKPYQGEEKSTGGIFVPDSFSGESDKGKIISVGNGTKIRPMLLKEGWEGYRVHGWGEPIEENGELFYIMEDSAIIAINQN